MGAQVGPLILTCGLIASWGWEAKYGDQCLKHQSLSHDESRSLLNATLYVEFVPLNALCPRCRQRSDDAKAPVAESCSRIASGQTAGTHHLSLYPEWLLVACCVYRCCLLCVSLCVSLSMTPCAAPSVYVCLWCWLCLCLCVFWLCICVFCVTLAALVRCG